MSNMSYCRFQNTAKDLADCQEALEEGTEDLEGDELRAKKRLVEMCRDVANSHGDDD